MKFLFLLFPIICWSSDITISADKLIYTKEFIQTIGRTIVEFEDTRIEGENVKINKDEVMSFDNAYISKEEFQFFGKKVEKKKDRLVVKDGWFTGCNKKKPHYKLTTEEIIIGPKIIRASKIAIRAGDMPVFFLPWCSLPLKERDAPYSIRIGMEDNLGLFVKTRYNYYASRKLSFLLDYYQKKKLGGGIEVSNWMGYYADKRWLFSGYERKNIAAFKIERQSDSLVSHDYFKKDIKEETKSYFLIEKSPLRLVLEESLFYDGKKWKREVYPKGEFFAIKPLGHFIFDLNIEGKKINPRFLGRLRNISGCLSLNSLSTNLRFFPAKAIKQDIEYLHSFKENEHLKFISDAKVGRLEIGHNLSNGEIEKIGLFLNFFKEPFSFSFDGIYKDKLKAAVNIEFERPLYNLKLFWLIKEKDKFFPSFSLRAKDGFSFTIAGFYEDSGEKRLDLDIKKTLHCIELGFGINTKLDLAFDLEIR